MQVLVFHALPKAARQEKRMHPFPILTLGVSYWHLSWWQQSLVGSNTEAENFGGPIISHFRFRSFAGTVLYLTTTPPTLQRKYVQVPFGSYKFRLSNHIPFPILSSFRGNRCILSIALSLYFIGVSRTRTLRTLLKYRKTLFVN